MPNWETLRRECLACEKCGLCATRTQVVFGAGSQNAEVLFVGEAPGQMEDTLGMPFVGRSGQLLDACLAGIGLSREKNIFITNIVKCRPPENRDPTPDERDTCLPWLRRQFLLLRPKIIVCLGRIAAQVMICPSFSVTREHGQWSEKKGVWFTATLHPAAVLRNPRQKPMVLEDFAAIRQKIEAVCTHTY